MELILELDSDAHASEHDISAQSEEIQVTLLTQTSHCGLPVQAVDLL